MQSNNGHYSLEKDEHFEKQTKLFYQDKLSLNYFFSFFQNHNLIFLSNLLLARLCRESDFRHTGNFEIQIYDKMIF